MKRVLNITKTILIFLLILFIVFFSIVNSEVIKINFNFFPFDFVIEIRIFLLIIFCFCIGFLLGILATSYKLIIKYFENLKNKRNIQKLEKQIEKIKDNKEENE